MEKLELLSSDLFRNNKIPNSQASKILGGVDGDTATVHTSQTTGWKYEDTRHSNGTKTVHFDKVIMP